MKTKDVFRSAVLFGAMLFFVEANAQKREFIHPGITYTQADLDRMKAMVEARQEPFYTTFQNINTSLKINLTH